MPEPTQTTAHYNDRFSNSQTVRKASAQGRNGAVVSQSRVATEAGLKVLRAGGNAVDAAIATSLAVGVAEPWMSGLGGGGLCLIYRARDQKVFGFDFGMRAPRALDPADYPLDPDGGMAGDLFGWPKVVEDRNLHGATAVAVPGMTAGLGLLHERFGSRSWASLFESAIALADEGLLVDWFAQHHIANNASGLVRDPGCRAIFLTPEGLPPAPVAERPRCRNEALAATLRTLADQGAAALHEGPLAQSVIADLQALGSRMTLQDLADTKPHTYQPVQAPLGRGRVWVLPELNGGPTILRALQSLQSKEDPFKGAAPDPAFFVAFAKAMQESFRYRLGELGDQEGRRGVESCTTHLSTVDGEGNMVAMTQTLLSVFGSRVLLPGSGLLMNNAINWFDPRPSEDDEPRPNALAPGKRPLCNYVPLIGEDVEGRFAVGGSGGRKIIPAVAQLAAWRLGYGLELDTAMAQPRLDVSSPESVGLDPRIGQDTIEALNNAGISTQVLRWGPAPNNFAILGCAESSDQGAKAAADPYHPWAEAMAF